MQSGRTVTNNGSRKNHSAGSSSNSSCITAVRQNRNAAKAAADRNRPENVFKMDVPDQRRTSGAVQRGRRSSGTGADPRKGGGVMIERINMNLKQIAESGQCFRWKQLDESGKKYSIVAYGEYLQIEEIEENCFELSCTQFDFITLWANYFDIDGGTDYEGIKAAAAEKGGLIADAVAEGAGIRILRQTAWEMLITFLTAQNISIARATTLIERLCEKYGCWKQTEGVEFTEFPTPEALATATPKDLRALGFGYRDKQIITAARVVASGAVSLHKLARLDHDTAKLVLKNFCGVGDKVAECICLFGLGQYESYPIDTWVQKIEDYFGQGYIQENFPDYAGIVQQYLFAYVRRHGLPERGNTCK